MSETKPIPPKDPTAAKYLLRELTAKHYADAWKQKTEVRK
jgi:hypothetical protein